MQLAENWMKISSMHGLFSEDMGIETALKLLSLQPDTVEVEVLEKEVIKEKIVTEIVTQQVEIDKPGMVPKSELEKAKVTEFL